MTVTHRPINTAAWERQWAVQFYDGLTTVPRNDPVRAQQILASYRQTAPYLSAALVSRLVTPWAPVDVADATVVIPKAVAE